VTQALAIIHINDPTTLGSHTIRDAILTNFFNRD